MNGKFKIEVSNGNIEYSLEIDHKITVFMGDSGTGKSVLQNIIEDYMADLEENNKSEISLKINDIDAKLGDIRVAPRTMFYEFVKDISDTIILIDEDVAYLNKSRFAGLLKNRDNYYIIMTRNKIVNLPYSVTALFEFKAERALNGNIKNVAHPLHKKLDVSKPVDVILTEDSKSSYLFFSEICKENTCFSLDGKTKIFKYLESIDDRIYMVLLDGAACGTEISKMILLGKTYYNVVIALPESFEWMVLKVLAKNYSKELEFVLSKTTDLIDNLEYFSWEQYYTDMLKSYYHSRYNDKYSKSELINSDLLDKSKDFIELLKPIQFNNFKSRIVNKNEESDITFFFNRKDEE